MSSLLVIRVLNANLSSGAAKNNTMEITLEGVVPETVVNACNAALAVLTDTALSLKQTLPSLRFQDGFWTLVTSCNPKFKLTIITEAFVVPIAQLGYSVDDGAHRQTNSLETQFPPVGIALAKIFAGQQVLVWNHPSGLADMGPSYRPTPAEAEGHPGELLSFDKTRSIEAAPGARFDLSQLGGNLVLGVGWDALNNKTFEMLYGNGAPPDIDVAVYTLNRWGEVMARLSPKGERVLGTPARVAAKLRAHNESTYESAIRISSDSRNGENGSPGDDNELIALNLKGLDDSVCSVLVTASIAGGARDFNYVRNLYVRVLDVVGQTMEVELCRFRLPAEAPQDRQTAVLLRIDRGVQGPDSFAAAAAAGGEGGAAGELEAAETVTSMAMSEGPCPPPSEADKWELTTIGGFAFEKDPSLPQISPEDVVMGLRAGHNVIPLASSALTVGAYLEGGVFAANIDRIQDANQHCAPITLLFFEAGGEVGQPNKFEVTFDSDPTKMLQLVPQALTWSSLSNVLGTSSREGIPKVKFVKNNFVARRTHTSLRPFLGGWAKVQRPDRVLLHEVKAFIYAKDFGGTTDAYCRAWYNVINTKTAAFVREQFEKEIVRSKVQKKLKCPALVSFDDFQVCVPIESMVGAIPSLIITVRDKDWGIGAVTDDTILKHKIDLTNFVYSGKTAAEYNTDSFSVMPDWVDSVNDVKTNAGFTKDMVTLMYKVTLLYPGQQPPEGTPCSGSGSGGGGAASDGGSGGGSGGGGGGGGGEDAPGEDDATKKKGWGW